MTSVKDKPFAATVDTPSVALYLRTSDYPTAILAGKLPGGLKPPSARALADELLVSRNTVLTAYDQLVAEGYLESVEGSGTFVADVLLDHLLTTPAAQPQPSSTAWHSETPPPSLGTD